MTTLTEQWKRDELPDGEYWCLSICGDVDKLYCYQNSFWKYKTEDDYYGVPVEIKQVLAEVPSYEQWQQLKELLKEAEKVIWEVMDCREDREFYRDLADEYYAKRSKMK